MPDLYCLHPSPFSGLAYTNVMPMLAQNRRVIAPDYPGYGGSDPFKAHPSIAEYAEAMLAVMDDLTRGGTVDLTGFHTGNLVAGEMSLIAKTFEDSKTKSTGISRDAILQNKQLISKSPSPNQSRYCT